MPKACIPAASLTGRCSLTASPTRWCTLGQKKPADGQFAIPIRRQEYRLVADQLRLRSAASNGVLVEGVSELQLKLLRTSTLAISGVRLSLTLTDPQQRVRPQTYRISVALGNPVDLL